MDADCEDLGRPGRLNERRIGITRVAAVLLCVSVLNWFSAGGRLSPEQVSDDYAELVLPMLRADPT
ncbi:hypothetical protein [Bradyrhizobium lablabi]|uniref:hypothetical protein n=1 Tax=Bradyrhizobium lablabi TaxID=722472 RepID=UPI003D9ADBAB